MLRRTSTLKYPAACAFEHLDSPICFKFSFKVLLLTGVILVQNTTFRFLLSYRLKLCRLTNFVGQKFRGINFRLLKVFMRYKVRRLKSSSISF